MDIVNLADHHPGKLRNRWLPHDLPVIFRRAAAGFNFWKEVLDPLVLLVCEFMAVTRHDKAARSVQ